MASAGPPSGGTEVVGTVRHPDGRPTGQVAGLVLREAGLLIVVDLAQATARARTGGLAVRAPGAAALLPVASVDPTDGRLLLAAGSPDATANLELELPIWDRDRACWVNPLRLGGAKLGAPG